MLECYRKTHETVPPPGPANKVNHENLKPQTILPWKKQTENENDQRFTRRRFRILLKNKGGIEKFIMLLRV
jgi:hypothetical protein